MKKIILIVLITAIVGMFFFACYKAWDTFPRNKENCVDCLVFETDGELDSIIFLSSEEVRGRDYEGPLDKVKPPVGKDLPEELQTGGALCDTIIPIPEDPYWNSVKMEAYNIPSANTIWAQIDDGLLFVVYDGEDNIQWSDEMLGVVFITVLGGEVDPWTIYNPGTLDTINISVVSTMQYSRLTLHIDKDNNGVPDTKLIAFPEERRLSFAGLADLERTETMIQDWDNLWKFHLQRLPYTQTQYDKLGNLILNCYKEGLNADWRDTEVSQSVVLEFIDRDWIIVSVD